MNNLTINTVDRIMTLSRDLATDRPFQLINGDEIASVEGTGAGGKFEIMMKNGGGPIRIKLSALSNPEYSAADEAAISQFLSAVSGNMNPPFNLGEGVIYTADGTLTGPRNVLQDGNKLTFDYEVEVARLVLPATTAGGDGVMYIGTTALFHTYGNANNLFFGKGAGNFVSSGGFGSNVGIGSNTLQSLVVTNAGQFNIAIGTNALQYVTTGDSNTAIGVQSGRNIQTGSNNTALGDGALYGSGGTNTGSGNVAIGQNTMYELSTGNNNVAIGLTAGQQVSTGSGNVFLGRTSGNSVTTGSGNVFLGHQSGSGFNGSNRLIIENSNDIVTPLIDGDFAAKTLTFNVTNLNISSLPTSAAGLVSGDIWNNSGVLNVVA